jgi:hypothetical protein
MATITEDLVLLMLDPETGRALVDSTSFDRAIGGALLLDLATRERLTADGAGAKARLRVSDAAPTGDALLDDALSRLAGSELRAQKAVERLARRTRTPVLERLVERGLVRRERTRLLGLLPVTAWPSANPGPRKELRGQVAAVLCDAARPDQHVALLISLVHAVKAEHKIVDGLRRQLRARAAEVAAGDWAGEAVRKARPSRAGERPGRCHGCRERQRGVVQRDLTPSPLHERHRAPPEGCPPASRRRSALRHALACDRSGRTCRSSNCLPRSQPTFHEPFAAQPQQGLGAFRSGAG